MNIASTKTMSLVIAIAMVVTLMGSTAFGAEKLLVAATRKGNWTGVGGVPLDDAQHLALSFDTTTTGVLKITYNAECGVVGSSGWGSVQIWVDGQQADPFSGTSFAFCSAEGNNYHFVGAVRQSLISVPIGTHVVEVTANGVGGVSKVWLGDSSIVVEQK
jgi:hypothetical protein